jgi:shikimate dehydrogenase
MTAHVYTIGWPVEHTRSPAIMNAAFEAAGIDARMLPFPVAPQPHEALRAAVDELVATHALGASITLPHKTGIVGLCDELSPEARAIGAVNCVVIDGTRVIGHNTDATAFLDALVTAGFELRGKRAVLLGAGGAARAVAHALRGGRAIEVVARRPEAVAWAVAWPWTDEHLRECFARADLVVDCTSAGLDPARDAAFTAGLPLDVLRPGAWIGTLVYHRRTRLLDAASGHPTFDGRAMLVRQAARAFELWTHVPAPVDIMTRALDASLVKSA